MSGTTCCLCRCKRSHQFMEPTTLPGSGYRCTDHEACAERVREIVSAHVGFGEIAREAVCND